MWSAPTERPARPVWPAWRTRLTTPHGLWLGDGGVWDIGPLPGWHPFGAHPAQRWAPVHHASFEAWCQAHAGRACNLVLSGWLVHELLLDRDLPLADDPARLAYARGVLRHYHGEPAQQWPLAAWQAAGRRGISALHAVSLHTLQAQARQAGVGLRSVRPWWSVALALALQQWPPLASAEAARLLVVDGRLVTQIDLTRGALVGLRQRRLAVATLEALYALADDASGTVCCALGHGLLLPAAGGATLPGLGITVLGSLHSETPAAWWALPADERQAGVGMSLPGRPKDEFTAVRSTEVA